MIQKNNIVVIAVNRYEEVCLKQLNTIETTYRKASWA